MGFRTDESGSTLPIFATSLAAVIALIGATIALGMDSRSANNLQIAADSAALGGATAFINATSPRVQDRASEAQRVAAAIANQNAGYTLTNVGIASLVEDAYGQHAQIEIALQFEPVNAMAKVAGRTSNIEIERKASATATWGFPLCILSLNKSGTGLRTSGDAHLVAENCVIWTNSHETKSMLFRGGRAEAKFFCSAGGADSISTFLSPRPHTDCDAIPDPLEDWRPPAPGVPQIIASLKTTEPQSRDIEKLLKELDNLLHKTVSNEDGKALKDAVKNGEPLPESAKDAFTVATLGISLSVNGRDDDDDDENSGLSINLELGSNGDKGKDKKKSDYKLNNILDQDGKFIRGTAEGLTPIEVAQIIGILDNAPETDWAGDSYVTNPTVRLKPDTYAGLDISEGHIEMEPGIYHIVGAPLIVRRKATLTGKGVTIIFHGDHASFGVLDGARLTLTAPEEGTTAGFVLAENRRARLTKSRTLRSRMTGKGAVEAIGTVYLPRQTLAITGEGAGKQSSPLLQIVADNVQMADQGELKIVFDTSKTDVPVRILPARSARLLH